MNFKNPFELFCESSLGNRGQESYKEVSDTEFANLIAESALAGAELISESNQAAMNAAIKCSKFTGDQDSPAYMNLIAEASTGVIGTVWGAIKKVFESIVNFIKGIIGKFGSGDGSKVTEEIAALNAKLEELSKYKTVPETAKVELQKHEAAAALDVAEQLLSTDNYLGLVATGNRDEKAPVTVGLHTANDSIKGITNTIEAVVDMEKSGTGDSAKVEAASKSLDSWRNSFEGGNTTANQDRIVGSIIKIHLDDTKIKSSSKAGTVDFTSYKYGSTRDNGKSLQEAIKDTFFDQEAKTFKGNEILTGWLAPITATVKGINASSIRETLVKGQKEFTDILDGWNKLETKIGDRKNEKGDDGNETERAKLASKVSNNMQEYSKVVALMNGALVKGFNIGNDLTYKAVQSLKTQVGLVDKIVVEKGTK